jgi:hypothetical protein
MAMPQTLLRVISHIGAGRMSGPVDRTFNDNRLHNAAIAANQGGSPVSCNGAGEAISAGRNTVDQLSASHSDPRSA